MRNAILWVWVLAMVVLGMGIVGAANTSTSDRITITISPSTLILSRFYPSVTVHTDLPYKEADVGSLSLEGIRVQSTYTDALGFLVAKFDGDAVKAVVDPGKARLTLIGLRKDGTFFAGSDVINVVRK